MLVEHHGTSFSDSEADTEPLPIIAETTELTERGSTRLRTVRRFAGKFALYQSLQSDLVRLSPMGALLHPAQPII